MLQCVVGQCAVLHRAAAASTISSLRKNRTAVSLKRICRLPVFYSWCPRCIILAVGWFFQERRRLATLVVAALQKRRIAARIQEDQPLMAKLQGGFSVFLTQPASADMIIRQAIGLYCVVCMDTPGSLPLTTRISSNHFQVELQCLQTVSFQCVRRP